MGSNVGNVSGLNTAVSTETVSTEPKIKNTTDKVLSLSLSVIAFLGSVLCFGTSVVIGASIGFCCGGPIGALIGGVAGGVFAGAVLYAVLRE